MPEAYKSFVTNASVLTAVKEHYDANYGIVFDETSVWLNSGKTGNYAGVGTRELAVDSDYGTVIKCEVEQKDESVANSERFSVLTPTALYNLVNGDSSITEVKFMFRVSKKLSGNVYFNGSNSSCEADTWTEYTLSRDAIIAKGTSGIRLTFLSLANDSAQTVYFTNFYYVKSAS